eukprot:5638321-Amphidinium_carterae.1
MAPVLLSSSLLLQVLQYKSDKLHHCQNECSKGQGPCVIPQSVPGAHSQIVPSTKVIAASSKVATAGKVTAFS